MALNNHQIDHYPWLEKAYHDLTLPLVHERAHHALLIKFITGCGEDILISTLAMRLLCLAPKHNQPCQNCHSCQLFLADHHPDYYIIEPEKNKQSIGIDQIRQISQKIYERAQQGGNKVIWVKTASLMTDAAANALLKTLEEPPENTYFLLSDIDNGQLLPTIRSRCQFYFLTIPELDSSMIWLKSHIGTAQYTDNELATALLLNRNAPLAALALLHADQWQTRMHFSQNVQTYLSESDFWSLRDTFINDQIFMLIDWFCSLLSDGLKATQKSGRFIINRDQVPLVRMIASFNSEKIIQLYHIWNETRQQLQMINGLNQELMISNLLAQSEIILQS